MITSAILIAMQICTQGTDTETVKKRAQIRGILEKQAQQYENCARDEDCTFFTHIEGLVINKGGLSNVSVCSKKLKKKIFPSCFKPNGYMEIEFGMEPTLAQTPNTVSCQNNKCVGVFEKDSKKFRNWPKENSLYLSKHGNVTRTDEFCLNALERIND